MNLKSYNIVVFTDGASRGNPGAGGFGAIVVKHDDSRTDADFTQTDAEARHIQVVELGGREERTTNNRMELRAAIKALSFLSSLRIKDKGLRIVIYTDSSYLVNGITKWIHGWKKNGWKTKGKKDVENRDLWETLAELTPVPEQSSVRGAARKEIEWKLVAGHAGVAGNQRCDEIATAFADGKTPKLYAGVLKNYSIKNVLEIPRGLTSNRERGQTSRQKKRSRAAAYSYVSMVGGKVETHKTWAECERRVKGKAGAKYRKVFSREEEQALAAQWRN